MQNRFNPNLYQPLILEEHKESLQKSEEIVLNKIIQEEETQYMENEMRKIIVENAKEFESAQIEEEKEREEANIAIKDAEKDGYEIDLTMGESFDYFLDDDPASSVANESSEENAEDNNDDEMQEESHQEMKPLLPPVLLPSTDCTAAALLVKFQQRSNILKVSHEDEKFNSPQADQTEAQKNQSRFMNLSS